MRAEAALDYDIDPPRQDALEFLYQRETVIEAAIFGHVDQQIYFAVEALFMAQD